MSLKQMLPRVGLAGIALTAVALFAPAPSAAAAEPATPAATNSVTSIKVPGHWYTYYENWFKTLRKCQARGDYMVANIDGIVDYRCWQGGGDLKWSMDVYDTNAFS